MKSIYQSIPIIMLAALGMLSSCSKSGSNPPPAKPLVLTVSTLAGDTIAGSNNGTGAAASFNSPSALVFNSSGVLFVGDWNNNLIRTINTGTGAVATFAGTVTSGFMNGSLSSATFYGTANIVFDKSGDMFVADEENNVIREISSSGNVTTLAGSGVQGYMDGNATTAEFNHPEGVVVDNQGNLFVVESNNNDVREVVIATGAVSTYAGNGTPGFADGAAASAEFWSPYGVAIDASNNLYIADIVNDRIRKITASTGMVSTYAGNGTQGLVNGAAASAEFWFPAGVAFDTKGNLYVGEIRNNVIRKITTGGVVSTYAGNGTQGSKNGPAASAEFYQPIGLRCDAAGNVYVADEYNNEIRKISETEQ